ncbi:hypothetical protein KC345_g6743 [Hortaea werneckii]|nr:hypothetical protein KC345_g6743 [Hortaea werneckii]
MRHTTDSETLTRILFERYTLRQEDVARVWDHVVKLTWGQSSEDRAPHMLYNRHVKGYGGSVKARATYAAIYDKDSPSKGELEKREVNRTRIARDAEDAMRTLGIVIQARHAPHERDATNTGTKGKAVEEQDDPTETQQYNADALDAQTANTSKRHPFDPEEFFKDITAAYKDRNYTGLSRSQRAQLQALLAENEISQRFNFTTRQDRLDMVHAHDLQLSDGHIFLDGQSVIPHDHPIYLLGGKALRVVFGEGDVAGIYDVMMCRFEICSYCQHFIQNKSGEPPTTQEKTTLESGTDILHGRPFVHTTDCENISQRPNYSELRFQGTRKDVLEGFPRLRDASLRKCEVSFKKGKNGWKKVEAELCGQCAHWPKIEYQATSRYGPGFYESFGRPNR